VRKSAGKNIEIPIGGYYTVYYATESKHEYSDYALLGFPSE